MAGQFVLRSEYRWILNVERKDETAQGKSLKRYGECEVEACKLNDLQ